MKIKIILPVLLSLYTVTAISQPGLIACHSERNPDNSISIIAESQAMGDYTIKIIFTSLVEYTTSTTVMGNISLSTVGRGRTDLIHLKNRTASASPFQYRYLYYPGRALRKVPDSSFIYLLPASAGKTIRVSKASSLAERLGQKHTDDYFGTGFMYALGDTICAARGGLVYACNDDVSEGEKSTDFFKSTRNKIRIQHADGSQSAYDVLAPIHLLVQPGENVYPGKPLAVFNRQSDKYVVLFTSFYLDEKKLLKDNDESKPAPSCFVHLPVHFITQENDTPVPLQLNNAYTAACPAAIVTAEMSKKEKKKLGL